MDPPLLLRLSSNSSKSTRIQNYLKSWSLLRDLFESYQASLTETTHFYRATNLRNSHISRSFCQGVLGSINGIRRGKRRNPLWIRVAIVPVSVSVYVSQHAAGNRGSLNIGMRIPFRCIKCDAIYENLHDFFFFHGYKKYFASNFLLFALKK